MEKIKCLILDDDLIYCDVIASYLEETPRIELAGKFTKPEKAAQFLRRNAVHLIFIDMRMPEMTGIEFLKSLSHPPSYTIILSSYSEYALDGYGVNAIDYIVKPFTEERFFAAVNKAIKQIDSNVKAGISDTLKTMIKTGEGFFFIYSNQQFIKIQYKDVLYMEALENFVKIHLCEGLAPVIGLISLKLVENTLSSEVFLRTHKSFIINMNHVIALDSDGVVLDNGKHLPVGRSYRETLMELVIKKHLIRH